MNANEQGLKMTKAIERTDRWFEHILVYIFVTCVIVICISVTAMVVANAKATVLQVW